MPIAVIVSMNTITELHHSPGAAELRTIARLFQHLSNGSFTHASDTIDQMSFSSDFSFLPDQFLTKLAQACRIQNWSLLSTPYINKEFISDTGYMLWVAPYAANREGEIRQQLTGLFAKLIPTTTQNEFKLSKHLSRLQKTPEIPNEIICVESIATFGLTGNESGEAFLVPNGWMINNSELGPAINDLRQQRDRFLNIGLPVIRKIFDPDSANLLLTWAQTIHTAYPIQSTEYQYHEYGHFTGISLNEKINKKLLICPWFAAVEEWRSDGIAFDLAKRCLSESDAAHMICANLCLRFGIDAQRAGGIENDTDANSCLILFDRMLKQGSIQISDDHQLQLKIKCIEDLLDCVSSTITDAISITHEESKLQDPRAIWNLYGGVQISPISRNLFELYVRKPCNTIESNLR